MSDGEKSFAERVEEIRERRRNEDDSSRAGSRGTSMMEFHFEAGDGAESVRGHATTSALGDRLILRVAGTDGRQTIVPLNRLLYAQEVPKKDA